MAEVDEGQKICDDLLVEIFLRLPIKSVFKFKCLSNTWNHLLSNWPFRNQYESVCRKSINLLPLLGIFRGFNLWVDSISDIAAARVCFVPTCLESMSIRSKAFINKIGECIAVSNGVILCGDGLTTYFVCNPIKDTWRKLPQAHMRYGLIGFLYEEKEEYDNGFRFTVVRVDCSLKYKIIELEAYCSDKGYWERYILCGVDEIISLHESYGCQVIKNTFLWAGVSSYNGNVFVAYKYKLGQNEGQRWAWLIQFEDGVHIGTHVLGESTQGRLLCAVNKGLGIIFYTLKKKLQSYSYHRVVSSSEWVQIIELNIDWTHILSPSFVISIHPQNSRLVLVRSGTTIYWYDVELGESRSIWHLGVPLAYSDLEKLMPFYNQYWPPLLR